MEIKELGGPPAYPKDRGTPPYPSGETGAPLPSAGGISGSPGREEINHVERGITKEAGEAGIKGLYQLARGSDGTMKIIYEDPQKEKKGVRGEAEENVRQAGEQVGTKEKGSGENASYHRAGGTEEEAAPIHAVTKRSLGITERLKRDIERLKKKKKRLEFQILAALGDEDRVKSLKKKLAAVIRELKRKERSL